MTRAAVSSARWDAEPPPRSMGIMPRAGKRYLVFQESMYSALPTNVMRRGRAHGRKKESITEVWLGHMIAPPSSGTFSRPSMVNFQSRWKMGSSTARAAGYSFPYSRSVP